MGIVYCEARQDIYITDKKYNISDAGRPLWIFLHLYYGKKTDGSVWIIF